MRNRFRGQIEVKGAQSCTFGCVQLVSRRYCGHTAKVLSPTQVVRRPPSNLPVFLSRSIFWNQQIETLVRNRTSGKDSMYSSQRENNRCSNKLDFIINFKPWWKITKLSKGAQRDNLFNSFLFGVSAPNFHLHENCLMFAPKKSTQLDSWARYITASRQISKHSVARSLKSTLITSA